MKNLILILFTVLFVSFSLHCQEDPYLWLEEIDGERVLKFAAEQNKITEEKFNAVKEYQQIYDTSLAIYNSTDKIIYPTIYGEYVYNFWKDKNHVRGIWRRSPKSAYIQGNPEWDILLDLDAMSKKDSIKWVYKGASGLYPDYNRFMVSLSKGGGDATVNKEFNVGTKEFIENGFFTSESKGGVSYVDQNTLIVTSDFGENTMTTSGYPNQVRLWKRGTPIKDAKLIYDGEVTDVGTWGAILRDGPKTYTLMHRYLTSFSKHTLLWYHNKIIKLDIPDDCETHGILKNQLIVDLKTNWIVDGKTYNQGSLISLNFSSLIKGIKEVQLLFEPDAYTSISQVSITKDKLLVNLLKNVNSELYTYSYEHGNWKNQKVDAPEFGTISIMDTDEFSDQYFFQFANFLTPTSLFLGDAKDNSVSLYKSLTAYFDGSKYEVKQFKVKSTDGTLIPYFMVFNKHFKKDSKNPTLLYAYGGFEVSSRPFYSGSIGNAWLENGGVFVLANIRGGGEYGPKWHQEGLKEKRQNVFDDFHAVAEDLINKKITSSKNLGIMGGSNGGLLVGVAFTQRPELYEAVVCQVPLLDMQRYNKLLAGASWMGEYGNPDKPEEWEYIKKYSPYHNLHKGVEYPEVYFYTSTRDDRVHPGHARKMVAKMIDMGHPVYYYENMEGGHAGASTNKQSAKSTAMTFSYLLMKLKK